MTISIIMVITSLYKLKKNHFKIIVYSHDLILTYILFPFFLQEARASATINMSATRSKRGQDEDSGRCF